MANHGSYIWASPLYDGESRDANVEQGPGTSNDPPAIESAAARVVDGVRSLKFDQTTDITRRLIGSSESRPDLYGSIGTAPLGIVVVTLAVGLDGAPSSRMCLSAGGPFAGPIAIDTNRKIQLLGDGSEIGDPSSHQITTTGMDKVVVVIDTKTLSTTWVAVAVKISGTWTEQQAFDTGQAPLDFWNARYNWDFGTSGDHGVTYWLDNCLVLQTEDLDDAPWDLAFPELRMDGQMINGAGTFAVGTHTDWAGDETDIDEDTGADESDFIRETDESGKQSFKNDGANPIPSGATVLNPQLRAWGKTATDKQPLDFMVRDGGQERFLNNVMNNPGYVAGVWNNIEHPNTGGGDDWERADWTPATAAEWGFRAADTDADNYVAFAPMFSALYYTETIPTTTWTTPESAATATPPRVMFF